MSIKHLTTLAGYVHWKLTGERVLGVGEAPGMFPIDSGTCDWNAGMAEQFDGILKAEGLPFTFREIMPRVLSAGEPADMLTAEGAALLDPAGHSAPASRSARPRVTQGPGWRRPMRSRRVLAMFRRERRSLLCWCWKSRFPRRIPKLTW